MNTMLNFYSRLKAGKLLITISLFSLCIQLTGQVPFIDKEKCFGGNDWDIPYDMVVTADTGYIVFGGSSSDDGDVAGVKGDRDLWLIRMNADFDTLWTKTYGGTDREWASGVLLTKDGGLLLSAEVYSSDGDVHGNHGDADLWLLKLNNHGDTLWTKCYGDTARDDASDAVQLEDNGYLVCGNTASVAGDVHGNHGGTDIWVLRIDESGDTLWTECYGGSNNDRAQLMISTSDGNFIIAGASSSTDGDVHGNHGMTDYYILKINADGDTLWTKCYGGSDNEGIYGIKQTSDSGFIVTGYSLSNDGDVSGHHGNYDAWILKLDDEGNTEWQNCFGGTDSEYTYSVIQTEDSNYVFAGYAKSLDFDVHGNQGEADCWLFKLDQQGDTLWTHCYGGSHYESIKIVLPADSGFVFAGYSNSEDGDVLSERYEGHDFWIVRLKNPPVPDDPEPDIQPDMINIYPITTHGMIYFPDQNIGEIRIYDSSGKLLIHSKDNEIDMTRYPAGIYFARFVDIRGKVGVVKVVVMK